MRMSTVLLLICIGLGGYVLVRQITSSITGRGSRPGGSDPYTGHIPAGRGGWDFAAELAKQAGETARDIF